MSPQLVFLAGRARLEYVGSADFLAYLIGTFPLWISLLFAFGLEILRPVSFSSNLTRNSATGLPRIVIIAKGKGRIANTNMATTSASKF